MLFDCNSIKQKNISINKRYEQAYQQHLKAHMEKTSKAGFPIINQTEFNRHDRTQNFYKTFERKLRNSILMKHGYKIASLQIDQEDLALYCFSLLQAQASFPIKIFIISNSQFKHPLDLNQIKTKDIWMQTYIMVESLQACSKAEIIFQSKIFTFFNDYLLSELRKFIKSRIKWDYMTQNHYTDENIIVEFKTQIITPANQKFLKLFN